MPLKRILLDKEGNKFYISDINSDVHTKFGYIKKKDLKKTKGTVKTNTGNEFFIFTAQCPDKFKKLKRGAQIITLKDAGTIITETGIGKSSKIVDAGGGSGALACILANIVKEITTYETRKDFVKIINHNIKNFELTNIKVKNKDITKGITEKNLDVITLDLPDPEKVLEHAAKSLKPGAFLVAYVPSVTQIISFVKKIRKSESFVIVKILENIQREWKVEGKIARPEFRMLGHTGFLIFTRKI